MWISVTMTSSEWSNYDKYLVMVLQPLQNSCSCYNIKCLTKFLISWYYFLFLYTFFLTLFYITVFNVLFIILNSSSSFQTHINIPNPLIWILNSIQLILSERIVLQTLLYSIIAFERLQYAIWHYPIIKTKIFQIVRLNLIAGYIQGPSNEDT